MVGWFANAIMRGYDEAIRRVMEVDSENSAQSISEPPAPRAKRNRELLIELASTVVVVLVVLFLLVCLASGVD